jgi:hypothetical protein
MPLVAVLILSAFFGWLPPSDPATPQPQQSPPASPQSPPPRDSAAAPATTSAVVRGRVLTATGEPIRRATVTLEASDRRLARRVATDAD